MSTFKAHTFGRRAARRRRLALLALWGAFLLTPAAMAGDGPAKPRTFNATECSEASVAGGAVMLCQGPKARSATVLRRWTVIKGNDGGVWVVGWTRG